MAPYSVTEFQVSAALWVIRAVDRQGSEGISLDSAFLSAVTLGRFPRPYLDNAFSLLVERGLIVLEHGRTRHHESLEVLLALPDATALPLLAVLLVRASGPTEETDEADHREATGALGEEAVVQWCLEELATLGYPELGAQVKRVSLISDRYGFDVTAPSIGGDPRMLEVKTSTSGEGKIFRLYLTRNEYDVGRRHPRQWALVACAAEGENVHIVGWCRASELERYLPDDGNGRWSEALVYLPAGALFRGVPSAVS